VNSRELEDSLKSVLRASLSLSLERDSADTFQHAKFRLTCSLQMDFVSCDSKLKAQNNLIKD
jgi:hypothetical protein